MPSPCRASVVRSFVRPSFCLSWICSCQVIFNACRQTYLTFYSRMVTKYARNHNRSDANIYKILLGWTVLHGLRNCLKLKRIQPALPKMPFDAAREYTDPQNYEAAGFIRLCSVIHCEPKKTHQNVLSYLLQNPADSDKIWYLLFWVNLSHTNVIYCT